MSPLPLILSMIVFAAAALLAMMAQPLPAVNVGLPLVSTP